MMNVNYPIIDADGHVLEKDRELHDYLGGAALGRGFIDIGGHDMGAGFRKAEAVGFADAVSAAGDDNDFAL